MVTDLGMFWGEDSLIDIVEGLGSQYIGHTVSHKNSVITPRNSPIIRRLNTTHDTNHHVLSSLIDVVNKHPDYVLSNFHIFNNQEWEYIEQEKLCNILPVDQLEKLFAAYQEHEALMQRFEKENKDYQEGKKGAISPYTWKPSLSQQSALLFDGLLNIDYLNPEVEAQLMRQHMAYTFNYKKSNHIPAALFMQNDVLRIAQTTGSEHNGHGPYSFEEYRMRSVATTEPDEKKILFPVTTYTLSFSRDVQGEGRDAFQEIFYT